MLPVQRTRRGFTLIELLVVIAIVAILAAILFPVFAKAREKARQSTCTNNQRQVAIAVQMYAQDHDELLPATAEIWGAIGVDKGVLVCPTKGKKVANGYGYNSNVAEKALGDLEEPEKTLLLADSDEATNTLYSWLDVSKRHAGQALCAYADGHVQPLKISVSLAMPTVDLMAGLPTTAGILPATGTPEWTRSPGTDTGNYTVTMDASGMPAGPSLYTYSNHQPGTDVTITRTLSTATAAKFWEVKGYVKCGNLYGGDENIRLSVFDDNATPKEIAKFSFERNHPNNNMWLNGVNTTLLIQNQDSITYAWQPFRLTVANRKVLFEYAGKAPREVAILSGSNWQAPRTLRIFSRNTGYGHGVYVDSLLFQVQ
jgi:prepilin-type N-terminal cleavage/methylation domain-containing protein/prepilin-type processing-associated H-X9-DG protein